MSHSNPHSSVISKFSFCIYIKQLRSGATKNQLLDMLLIIVLPFPLLASFFLIIQLGGLYTPSLVCSKAPAANDVGAF